MEHRTGNIGLRLREAREARGLTLREIAETTKISMRALKAIEDDKLSELPGGVFARAYLRAFAAEVGVNGDDIVDEFRQRYEPEPPAPPPRDPGVRSRRLRLAAAGICLIAGILVVRSIDFNRPQPDGAQLQTADPEAVETLVPNQGHARIVDLVLAHVPAPTGTRPLRLDIRVSAECWMSASADGQRVLYRLMHAGESALIEASDTIDLHVGNAGAVEYWIDGRPGRRLGRDGEVVTIQVTSDDRDLHVEPTAPEPPDDLPGVARRTDQNPVALPGSATDSRDDAAQGRRA